MNSQCRLSQAVKNRSWKTGLDLFQDISTNKVGGQGLGKWLNGEARSPEGFESKCLGEPWVQQQKQGVRKNRRFFLYITHTIVPGLAMSWPNPYLLLEVWGPSQSGHIALKGVSFCTG